MTRSRSGLRLAIHAAGATARAATPTQCRRSALRPSEMKTNFQAYALLVGIFYFTGNKRICMIQIGLFGAASGSFFWGQRAGGEYQ